MIRLSFRPVPKFARRSRVLSSWLAAALWLGAGGAAADSLADGIVSEQLTMDDEFVTGLDQPTAIAFLPDGRVLIAERTGGLHVRMADGTMTTAATMEVDFSHGERGLLNVLPHPEFEDNHLLYFYYSATAENGGTSADRHRVATIELGDDNLLDMSTEQILLQGLQGPANHNGGGLSIYGDYLFVGTGDTGNNSNSPPGENLSNFYGTCLTNAQGKVLRIHLDGTIPDDNPLIGQTVTECGSKNAEPTTTSDSPREEIFAWGFRNAFRLWADPQTGNVWVGNVGEITYEMIQLVPPEGGVHFGWPYREGNEGLPANICQTTVPNTGDCVDAVYVCEQSGGGDNVPPDNPDVPNDCDSITGGLILDDCAWPPEFRGKYVFGDYTNERVWTLPVNETRDNVIGEREPLLNTPGNGPVQFVENEGALYVVGHSGNGHITRIAPVQSQCDTDAAPDAGAAVGDQDSGSPSPTDTDSPTEENTDTSTPSPEATDVPSVTDDSSPTGGDEPATTDTAPSTTDDATGETTDEGSASSDDENSTDPSDASGANSDGDCDCSLPGRARAPSPSGWLLVLAAACWLRRAGGLARKRRA